MDAFSKFFEQYELILAGIAAILTTIELIFAPIRSIRKRFAAPDKVQIVHQDTFAPIQTPPPPVEVEIKQSAPSEALVSMSLDEYEKRLQTKITYAQTELETAHGEEIVQFLAPFAHK